MDVTDVLRLGGYDPNNGPTVQRAADILTVACILVGTVKTASKALDEMLYNNSINPGTVCLEIEDYPFKDLASITDTFRKGKDIVLGELLISEGDLPGGPRATLATDAECRQQFIALCRANNEMREITQQRVASDRRNRMTEQNRVKRECLYFFQKKNGTATTIMF